ncbi:hypothetical protein CNY89_14330 [Amaricoccus sp. HAR-UPW-R2A-40]|nr:hypothetical protein CNY89_14330 [Amaricoccus sp. HAR-UPW-R2A-40]
MVEEQNRSWTDRYMLRFPDGMREQIKRLAEANNRSMNAEIISALEFHLSQNKIEELRAKHPPASHKSSG